MGVSSWFINQLKYGGPHPGGPILWEGDIYNMITARTGVLPGEVRKKTAMKGPVFDEIKKGHSRPAGMITYI